MSKINWNWDPVPKRYRSRSRPATRQSIEYIQLLATRTTTTTTDTDTENPFAPLKAIADIYRRKRQSSAVEWSFKNIPDFSISSDSSDESQTQTQNHQIPLQLAPMTSTPQSIPKSNPRLRALKKLDPNSISKVTPKTMKTPKTAHKSFIPDYMERTILDSSPFESPFTPKTVVKKRRQSRANRFSTTTQTDDSIRQMNANNTNMNGFTHLNIQSPDLSRIHVQSGQNQNSKKDLNINEKSCRADEDLIESDHNTQTEDHIECDQTSESNGHSLKNGSTDPSNDVHKLSEQSFQEDEHSIESDHNKQTEEDSIECDHASESHESSVQSGPTNRSNTTNLNAQAYREDEQLTESDHGEQAEEGPIECDHALDFNESSVQSGPTNRSNTDHNINAQTYREDKHSIASDHNTQTEDHIECGQTSESNGHSFQSGSTNPSNDGHNIYEQSFQEDEHSIESDHNTQTEEDPIECDHASESNESSVQSGPTNRSNNDPTNYEINKCSVKSDQDDSTESGHLETNEGPRRSKRMRMPILEYWRGQRPVYKRDSSGVTEKVVEIVDGFDYSQKSRKKVVKKRKVKEIIKKDRNIFDLSIHANVKTDDIEVDVKEKLGIKPSDDLKWNKSKQSNGVDIAIIQKDKYKGESTGIMRLMPMAKKNKSKTGDYVTHLIVVYGALLLKIEDNPAVIVNTLSSFKVEANTYYELDNLRNDTAYVQFTVLKV